MGDPRLQQAVEWHRAGLLDRAEQAYRGLIEHDASQPDAWHLLGVLARQQGRADEAVSLIEHAIQLAPHQGILHYNLAQAFMSAGRVADAIGSYRAAVELQPTLAEAWQNLGSAYLQTAEFDRALVCFQRVCQLCPQAADAHANLALALEKLNRCDEALAAARFAVSLDPQNATAANQLALCQRPCGQDDQAEATWRACLVVQPEHVPALSNLARLLHDQERFDEAQSLFERALQLDSHGYQLLVNAGVLAKDLAQFEQATQYLNRAVGIHHTRPEAWLNLGKVHEEQGQLRLALRFFDEALKHSPGNPEIRMNRALVSLQLEQFDRGWDDYEARWQIADAPPPSRVVLREWQGEPLTGKKLLIIGEQGVGDQIMFASCIPELLERGAEITLLADVRLVPVFARSFPRARVLEYPRTDDQWRAVSVDADYQVALGSLPRWLRRTRESFPGTPFLVADHASIEKWRKRYEALGPHPKIGISWRAGTTPKTRRHRSAPIPDWELLLSNVRAHFVSLQYGATAKELNQFTASGTMLHAWCDSDPLVDLDDFAAQLAALDLVISVGNATVHMAGGLGVPCWVLLPRYWGWRWGADRSSSCWYGSLRLVRQSPYDDWPQLFARIAADLSAMECDFADLRNRAGASAL